MTCTTSRSADVGDVVTFTSGTFHRISGRPCYKGHLKVTAAVTVVPPPPPDALILNTLISKLQVTKYICDIGGCDQAPELFIFSPMGGFVCTPPQDLTLWDDNYLTNIHH